MAIIYITGIEGSGKSTVCAELKKKGYAAYDMDEEKIAAIHSKRTNVVTEYPRDPAMRTVQWRAVHSWKIIDKEINSFYKKHKDEKVFLCGTAENEEDYFAMFSKIIALRANAKTIASRLKNRKGRNTYGKSKIELNTVLEKQRTIKEKYREMNAVVVDSDQPIESVVDQIILLCDR